MKKKLMVAGVMAAVAVVASVPVFAATFTSNGPAAVEPEGGNPYTVYEEVETEQPIEISNVILNDNEGIKTYDDFEIVDFEIIGMEIPAPEGRLPEETYSVGLGETLEFDIPETYSVAEGTWTVEDESIATVDENGVITAVGEGTTVVTYEKDGEVSKITVDAVVR